MYIVVDKVNDVIISVSVHKNLYEAIYEKGMQEIKDSINNIYVKGRYKIYKLGSEISES